MTIKDYKKATATALTFFFILSFTGSDCRGDHSSGQGSFAKVEAPGLDEVTIYPNPFRPGKDGELIFKDLPKDSTIRIYNIAGELVRLGEDKSTGLFSWDGTNDKGRKVTGGVYIYLIKDGKGKTKRGKIAVIW